MNKTKATSILTVALVAMLIASSASAAIFSYSTRATFDAAVTNPSIENWDSFADGTTFANGSTANGITYNSSVNIAVVGNYFLPTTSPNSLGRTPIEYFEDNDSITFTFVVPIVAFGIDINTFATAAGSFQAVTDLSDQALSGFDPFPGRGTGQFVGFTSDQAISSVTISVVTDTSADESYTLDTMRFQGVPEPMTFAIWAILGVMGTTVYLKRKRTGELG